MDWSINKLTTYNSDTYEDEDGDGDGDKPIGMADLWSEIVHSTHEVTVFTRISVAALIKIFEPQIRRLIEGGAYLKIGRYNEIFSFYLTVYLPTVRKNYS